MGRYGMRWVPRHQARQPLRPKAIWEIQPEAVRNQLADRPNEQGPARSWVVPTTKAPFRPTPLQCELVICGGITIGRIAREAAQPAQ
ncbi:hypothetical protein SAMD00023353_0501190 [Rosellinia necatrix]|uniref:Uncharacterized protein n=1 Tax=Rosellinia necatrix TaxID=77044 RepID=A0A1S8A5H2_ROSNE|nr:hypothetical protein SAMD00023353_0501190 [Rosellinia necatrix]